MRYFGLCFCVFSLCLAAISLMAWGLKVYSPLHGVSSVAISMASAVFGAVIATIEED